MTSKPKINVLLVDDSSFMRKALRRMLKSDPGITVVGEAQDGEEAIEMVKALSPDVITLDIRMPRMDGLKALEIIMREKPTPIVMVSSLTNEGGNITLQALSLGAVDFIDKSSAHTTMDIIELGDALINKIKIAATVNPRKISIAEVPAPLPLPEKLYPQTLEPSEAPKGIIAIGSSTGGPVALEKILTQIPSDFKGAILITQHMPVGFTLSFSERLNKSCNLSVREAKEGDPIVSGVVYIAPGGYHLKVKPADGQYFIDLSKEPKDAPYVPSADIMMESLAKNFDGKMMAIILTGMGNDGSEGIKFVKQHGGLVVAQDKETSIIYGMPRTAFETGCVDKVLPLYRIADAIKDFGN